MYNKVAIYKFKECHPEEYSAMTVKASAKWRNANLIQYNEREKLRKRFITEVRRLRNIDLF